MRKTHAIVLFSAWIHFSEFLEWLSLSMGGVFPYRVVEAHSACLIDVDAADLIQDVLTVFQCHQYSALCCRMSRLVTCAHPVDGGTDTEKDSNWKTVP